VLYGSLGKLDQERLLDLNLFQWKKPS